MSRNFTPDQVLIDRLLSNDTEAFEELYRRYWYSLYIYSFKKLYSSEDARRIVRDIFIQLWEKRHSWPAEFSISQHLYTEIRKSVIESLNAKLNITSLSDEMEHEIASGFSVEALQQARVPVRPKIFERPVIHQKMGQTPVQKNHPKYGITITNLKWLFQTVTAKLL